MLREYDLDGAEEYFLRLLSYAPNNPDIHAWLAAIYMHQMKEIQYEEFTSTERYDEYTEALRSKTDQVVTTALEAIRLDSCHSMAWCLLADIQNPQYNSLEESNADIAWIYMMKSVKCNPAQGNGWMGIWVEAMRRGEVDMEHKALRSLLTTKFIPNPYLSYSRWLLKSLPDSAILLTNGDMDTYPVLALQVTERLRPDVAVINMELMQAEWYAQLMNRRHKLLFTDSVMATMEPRFEKSQRTGEQEWTSSKDRILQAFIEHVHQQTLLRPLALDLRSSYHEWWVGKWSYRFVLQGPFRLYHASESILRSSNNLDVASIGTGRITLALYIDTVSFTDCLKEARTIELAGPIVAEQDYSALRARGFGASYCFFLFAKEYYEAALNQEHEEEKANLKEGIMWSIETLRKQAEYLHNSSTSLEFSLLIEELQEMLE